MKLIQLKSVGPHTEKIAVLSKETPWKTKKTDPPR